METRTNDEIKNLVAIQFNDFRFELLPRQRVLYVPPSAVSTKKRKEVA